MTPFNKFLNLSDVYETPDTVSSAWCEPDCVATVIKTPAHTIYPAKTKRLVESFTKEYLVALLDKCNGNISQMAREAGIARNYVHRLVTKYGLKAHE